MSTPTHDTVDVTVDAIEKLSYTGAALAANEENARQARRGRGAATHHRAGRRRHSEAAKHESRGARAARGVAEVSSSAAILDNDEVPPVAYHDATLVALLYLRDAVSELMEDSGSLVTPRARRSLSRASKCIEYMEHFATSYIDGQTLQPVTVAGAALKQYREFHPQ